MPRYSGKQFKGAARALKQVRRAEAEQRQRKANAKQILADLEDAKNARAEGRTMSLEEMIERAKKLDPDPS